MTRRISAREARANFAELTDSVKYTGEPVIIEKQGRPCVALISADDLELLQQSKAEQREQELIRLGARAAVRKTRREMYYERYGDAYPSDSFFP